MILNKSEQLVLDMAKHELPMNMAHNKLSGDAFFHLCEVAKKLERNGFIEFKETFEGKMYMTLAKAVKK